MFHSIIVLYENEYFLISNLYRSFTNASAYPLVVQLLASLNLKKISQLTSHRTSSYLPVSLPCGGCRQGKHGFQGPSSLSCLPPCWSQRASGFPSSGRTRQKTARFSQLQLRHGFFNRWFLKQTGRSLFNHRGPLQARRRFQWHSSGPRLSSCGLGWCSGAPWRRSSADGLPRLTGQVPSRPGGCSS